MEGRTRGGSVADDRRRRGLYVMRAGGAGFSCAGRLLVGGPACAAALIVGVVRCRCCASLAARRMIVTGCRCKPFAAAAPVVYRWPLYCIRCASAAADDLKKTL